VLQHVIANDEIECFVGKGNALDVYPLHRVVHGSQVAHDIQGQVAAANVIPKPAFRRQVQNRAFSNRLQDAKPLEKKAKVAFTIDGRAMGAPEALHVGPYGL